ncbi:MAG TPA: hypothetical protein VHQ66_15720 [Myxococcota bacterium]|nr:hypothetical protein [Myxococcota bacterium]
MAAEDAPRSAPEALARAARHARLAAAEALAAWRALVDAGALLATGAPSARLRGVGGLARATAEIEAALRGGAGAGGEALVAALAEALDAEIARWEARSAEDADARAVLRAFLGLRELLWEVGVRAPATAAPAPTPAGPRARPEPRRTVVAAPRARRRSARVERLPVEG